ncbi:C2H2-type zinc finger-containing protein [Heterostelium album PN500]|uniref:C2H2-type zinc finger-containing protein n=1 Tax=Heterostelium pallidum (strain ATCC 26659 / Pp 5 / PN500) TaxID=670386 RepID=D3BE05_HETP5|nr:C2H2-type zinc finger-containing protein [Heterostelium album PN500]EFA80136.1 C2H2-type zinc finger-containing protein [Heterostelium album PN500]|eukprot:XP_020432256.1 C2H2-type zinc finger-containing protein [Heterostelium album PN500]
MTDMERRWDDDDDDSHHRSRYNGTKQESNNNSINNNNNSSGSSNSNNGNGSNGGGNKDEDDEPVDEFGRPLRPGRESSDSDSDHDYRYRRRSRGDRRDNRYSPDNNRGGGGGSGGSGNRKRDHSPSSMNGPDKRTRGDTSPRDNYRDRRRRDDWNDRSNDYNGRQLNSSNNSRNNGRGDERSLSPSKSSQQQQQSNTGSTGMRRPKRGDIFEGGVFKTYKQFLDYQDDSITPTDAEKKYEEYKLEFSKRQARVFFKDHQTEEWFREKYDPVFLKKKKLEKMEFAKTRVPAFITMLDDENFNFNLTAKDNIKDSEKLVNSEGMEIEHDDTNEHEHTDSEHHHDGEEKTNSNNSSSDSTTTTTTTSSSTSSNNTNNSAASAANKTLFIKAISPTCTKDDLLEVLNKVGTEEEPVVVTKLTLSEPMKYKNFYRLGWVTFKTSEYSMKALKELNGTKVPIDTQKKFRITPKIASTEQRISVDLKQATEIAKNLDVDRDISNNPLWTDQIESLSEMDRLDRTIHYLRYVHLFCYYCSEEYADVDEIERKCGSVHLRRPIGAEDTTTITAPKPRSEEMSDEITNESNNNNNEQQDQTMDIDQKPSEENTWVTNLDNNIKAKIVKINNQEQYEYTQAIAKSAEEFIQINTFKMEEEKYRCSLCCKLFKGSEYVKKHINLKHPEELKEDSHKKGTEEQFFLNYFSDPRRMIPPTQQQLLYYQNPRGMMAGMTPRPRWNPTLGTWEQQMVMPQMIPAMIPSTPPMAMGGQIYPVSPLFSSPNVRGRGLPLPMPVPMRRGAYPQQVGGPPNQASVIPSPSQNVRYRPYPSAVPQQRTSVPLPPADPRGIREYVDLDAAPTGAMPEIDYTAALKQFQSKRANQ